MDQLGDRFRERVVSESGNDGIGRFDAVPHWGQIGHMSAVAKKSIQPVKFTEFVRPAPGKLDAHVIGGVEAALKRWFRL